MSEYVHMSHNVSVLLYHLVFPAKCRQLVMDDSVDLQLGDLCFAIETLYKLKSLEIGSDGAPILFLAESVWKNSVTSLVTLI